MQSKNTNYLKSIIYLISSTVIFLLANHLLFKKGAGFCFTCEKLPNSFEITRNFSSDGYMLIEKKSNGVILNKGMHLNNNIYLPHVADFNGYWYDNQKIVCEFSNGENQINYAVVYYNNDILNVKSVPKSQLNTKGLNYIDLTKNYFGLQLLLNFLFFGFLFLQILGIFKRR